MKKLSLKVISVLIGIPFLSVFANAQEAKKVTKDATAGQASAQSTSHSFDDFLVQGKFHFSDHTVVTVEEDKALDGLVGVRRDFKDRVKQSLDQL